MKFFYTNRNNQHYFRVEKKGIGFDIQKPTIKDSHNILQEDLLEVCKKIEILANAKEYQ